MSLLRILIYRGTKCCDKAENHDYELYLEMCEVDHSETKAKSFQTNGICERFYRTLLNEFYRIAFRKTIYESIEALQRDLDQWIDYYNHDCNHQGKMCCARKTCQTWLDGKVHLTEKIDQLHTNQLALNNN